MGSYDQAKPANQMKAVDLALKVYFETEDWLTKRKKEMPGVK